MAAGRLWLDDKPVELRPKTWEVLCVLAERSGELVTKNELLDRVWADTAVSEGTLNKSIGELRTALDDSRGEPRCIETVPRRGYRWIGRARIVARPGSAAASMPALPAQPVERPSIVARDSELARLDAALARARSGRRQVLFVTGEAGAGKTTVVDHFLLGLPGIGADGAVLVLHGQCLETSGPHEPYLPLFEGLERLARDPVTGSEVTAVLRRSAPAWVAQMPALAPTRDPESAAPGSMLRELNSVVDELSRNRPLAIVLEDAHWADLATTDAIASLARRRDAARLLVIVTKRNAEAIATQHAIVDVKHDLVSRGIAEEVNLVPFGEDELLAYLGARCPGLEGHAETSTWLLQQTAGNPLFVRLVLDDWIARGLVAESASGAWSPMGEAGEMRQTVPDSLRALLERQVERLAPEEKTLLEAASVRIGGFHAAQLANALAMDADDVDSLCARIIRRSQLLRSSGEAAGPGGLPVDHYSFFHATVQNVVAAGLSSARRRRLHLAAAEQLEGEYAGRSSLVCTSLAAHYEAGGDFVGAARNLREAGRQAMLRDAPRDAIVTLESALELLDSNPRVPEAESLRVLVMSYLTHSRQLAFGFVDSQVAGLWSRTSELAAASENLPERVMAETGRIVAACVAGRYAEAEEAIRGALPLLDRFEENGVKKSFFFGAGCTRYRLAAMADSCRMFDTALAMTHESDPIPGAELDALLMSQYAPAVALTGRPDEVRVLAEKSLAKSRVHSHYAECVTGTLVSWALALVGDYEAARPISVRALEIAEADNFRTWSTRPLFVLGLSDMQGGRLEEGIAKIRAGLEGRKGDGQLVDHSAMCCLFAEALMDAGRAGAEAILDEGAEFAESSGELYAESEILRLRARLLLHAGDSNEAETLLRRALELAQLRGIHWHSMLAATDLVKLLAGRQGEQEAASVLARELGRIAGGTQLEAVRAAHAILERGRMAAPAA